MKNKLKKWYNYATAIILVAALLMAACTTSRQSTGGTATEADLMMAIDSSNWIFTPSVMIPAYGNSRQITSSYSLRLSNNKLWVYLPYYGRASAGADLLSGKGPMDFTSNNFVLDKQQTKQGEWSIDIKPNDNREIQAMHFTLFSNGSASLDVNMINRSAVSYQGNVLPGR